MKLTLKIALVISLFCGTALADGDMGAGGKSCEQGCLADGGQNTEILAVNTGQDQQPGGLFFFIKDYLESIFG